MWYYNKTIGYTWVHHTTQYACAYIVGLGWKRVKPGSPDGCTNLVVLLNAAKASGRLVHVYIDSANQIATAYMV